MLQIPRIFSILLVCTAGLLLSVMQSTAASGTAGATKWEVSSPFSLVPSAGFVPVTISATNQGNKATTANYSFEMSMGYYNANSTTVAAGSMKLPPKKPMTVTHWIWRGSQYEDSYGQNFLRFNIDTPAGRSSDTMEGGSSDGSRIAVSRKLRASAIASNNERVVTFDPKSLPADWRVFSSLHAIFLHSSDWDDLSPGVRDAMRTWIGMGGAVRIADSNLEFAQTVVDQLVPSDQVLGVFAPESAVLAIPEGRVGTAISSLLNHRDLVFTIGAPQTTPQRMQTRRRNYRYDDDEGGRRRDSFPLRDEFGRRDIPYFFVCMLLIVFAVLVGPVALRLWAGPGKRHRLFFTTPVLSLSASALMLLLMLFQDGLGIDGRRVVLLDLAPVGSSQPNALVYQEQFSRAGMVGSRGFDVEEGLYPIIPNDAFEEGLSVREGRARGDWFSSRRDRSVVLAGSVPIRWGVTHEGVADDQLTLRLESPLGEVEDAWYIDGDGLMWMWNRNSPGTDGTFTFKPAGRDPEGLLKPLFVRCSGSLQNFLLKRVKQKNQRNRFWAMIKDGEEAARATDPKIDWKESNLILTSKVTPKN